MCDRWLQLLGQGRLSEFAEWMACARLCKPASQPACLLFVAVVAYKASRNERNSVVLMFNVVSYSCLFVDRRKPGQDEE